MNAPTTLNEVTVATAPSVDLTSNDGALQNFIDLLTFSNAFAQSTIAPTLPLLTLTTVCSDNSDGVPSLLATFTLPSPMEHTRYNGMDIDTTQVKEKDLDWLRRKSAHFGSDQSIAGVISKEEANKTHARWIRAISGVLTPAYQGLRDEIRAKSAEDGPAKQQSCCSKRRIGSADAHTGDTPRETAISSKWGINKAGDGESNVKSLGVDVKVYFDTEGVF